MDLNKINISFILEQISDMLIDSSYYILGLIFPFYNKNELFK